MSQTVNELVSRPNEIRVRGLYPPYTRDSMSQTVNELVSRLNEIRVRGLYPSYTRDSMSQTVSELVSRRTRYGYVVCTCPTKDIACRKL